MRNKHRKPSPSWGSVNPGRCFEKERPTVKLASFALSFLIFCASLIFAQNPAPATTALKEYSNAQGGFAFKYPDRWTPMAPDEVKQKTQGTMQVMPGTVIFLVNDRDADRNLNLQI